MLDAIVLYASGIVVGWLLRGFLWSRRTRKSVALQLADECIRQGSFIRAVCDVVDEEKGQAIVERANEYQSEYDVSGEWRWDGDEPENPGL